MSEIEYPNKAGEYRLIHRYAITDLWRYAQDDSIDYERLKPLLDAMKGDNWELVWQLGVKILPQYAACSVFIDNLLNACERNQ